MKAKETMSNNSFKLLKNEADKLLMAYLKKQNESKDFHNFRRWIINKVIDKHNTKLPMDIVIEYYNYCVTEFK
tara:strand:+ start:1255 stop:1473 length:219 start_codon:yes stop_codon:yes gene_type:complete